MRTSSASSDLPVFLTAALLRPDRIGAVFPSSRGLAEVLAEVVPCRGEPTVLELGAGTGAVSTVIGGRLPDGGRHLAVEIDPHLAASLRRTCPWIRVHEGDAAELDTLLDERNAVDAVVSGLPWSLFDERQQRRILGQVGRVLAPGAGFTTFAYLHALALPGARRFRRLLRESFGEVVITRTVWRNLPPALAYVCRYPYA